jgi:hypothetical protein
MRERLRRLGERPVTLRLPPDLLERAERLLPGLGRDPRLSALASLSRSQVLRLALLEGLQVLERRYRATERDPGDGSEG